jgi:hypothetical protein
MSTSTVFFKNEEDLPRLIESSGEQRDRLAQGSRGQAEYFRLEGNAHHPGSLQERVSMPGSEIALKAAGSPGIYVHGSFVDLPDQSIFVPGLPTDPTDPSDPGRPRPPREVIGAKTTWSVAIEGDSVATREGMFFNPESGQNEHAVVGGWIVELVLESLRTTYYIPFGRDSRNPIHGTLGRHEDLHKDLARNWWVLSTLQTIQLREDIALFWVAWSGAPYPDPSQVQAIADYFNKLHYWEQRRSLDLVNEALPTFTGQRATAPSHTVP